MTGVEAPGIVLADDSAIMREGLAGLLERRGYRILAQETRADLLQLRIAQLAQSGCLPELLIVDVRMPPTMTTDGLQAAVSLKGRYPSLSVMVLSQYIAPAYAQRLFGAAPAGESGGTGYLLKDRVGEVADFVRSLQIVLAGGVVIDPQIAKAMIRSRQSGVGDLSAREFEVLELMAKGLSNTQIAGHLALSGAAVAKHVSNVFAKLHLEPGEENRRVRAILAYLTDSGMGGESLR